MGSREKSLDALSTKKSELDRAQRDLEEAENRNDLDKAAVLNMGQFQN